MTVDPTEPQRALITLLRQLWGGFLTYRLFSGDEEQEGFVEASTRIHIAAEAALTGGPVSVEVHGSDFLTEAGPLPSDETLQKLALALFERRVELLRVRAVPSTGDLVALFRILLSPVEDVAAGGGAGASLKVAGVTSIALNAIELSPIDAALAEGLATKPDLWELLQSGVDLDERPMAERSGAPRPPVDAPRIYQEFGDLIERLPKEIAHDPDLYGRLRDAVARLPKETQDDLAELFVTRVRDDPMADRFLGTMTDARLAHMLAEIDLEGTDGIQVARDMVAGGMRRGELVDLVSAAISVRRGTEGSSAAFSYRTEEDELDRRPLLAAVSELLEGNVMAHEHDDLRSIREEFPRTEQELESIAMASFLDYLLVEVDLERLEEVLEVWANDARSSMAEGAMDRALWLMEVADVAARASQPGDTQRRRLFEEKKKRVLDKSVLGDLMQTGGDHASADPVLAMFGGAAAETLLDWLADEDDRTRRVTIINRLAEMTDEHLEVITERLSDPRWFVVRNIVTILHRSKHASSFVPLFERAANHQHPSVVKEAVAALGSVNTAAAASVLADLVYSGSDPETKRRALEELGKNRTPQAIAVLRSMASFRGKPRIRRSLRRQAKKLLRSQAAR